MATLDWCSVYNTPAGCSPKMASGQAICRPMTAGAKAQAQALQAALNVLLKLDKKKVLSVDGEIGPATLAAAIAYAGSTYGNTCQSIADSVSPITTKVQGLAAARTVVAANTGIVPPAAGPQVALLPNATQAGFPLIVGVALLGGLGLWMYFAGRGEKKKPAPLTPPGGF